MTLYSNVQFGNVIFGNVPQTIVIGNPDIPITPLLNYRQVSRLGDICSCGASIISGCSFNTFINNLPAALQGCITSHSSIIVLCSALCMVNNRKIVRMMDMHSGCPTFPPHSPSPVITSSPNVYAK